jgi:hypothetical protein
VELKLLHDSLVLLTIDSQVDAIDVGRINEVANLRCSYRETESYGQTVLATLLAIQVARNRTALADFTSGLLASSGAGCALYVDTFHFVCFC